MSLHSNTFVIVYIIVALHTNSKEVDRCKAYSYIYPSRETVILRSRRYDNRFHEPNKNRDGNNI